MTSMKTMGRLMIAGTATALLASAAWADGNTIKGIINANNGATIDVVDSNNVKQVITLLPTTTIKAKSGALDARKADAQPTALIPGLPITADVVANGAAQDAVKIEFKASDLKTAQQIQAGLNPTAQQVEANTSRMNDFGTLELITSTDVFFASGSTAISAQGKSDLMAFAQKAKATKGYQVVVLGFTDSTGNAARNEVLSKARADNVQNFLLQNAGLMPARVQAGDGMGVAADAGSGSNKNARKVTVRLGVDKGVADGN